MSLDEMWGILEDQFGVLDSAIQLVVGINGYNRQTMEDILYFTTGLHSFDQVDDES